MRKYHTWDGTKGHAIAFVLFLILVIVPVLCFISCTDVNPERYKGCVVIEKTDNLYLRLKLTKHLSDSLNRDYMWICVPKWEIKHYEIGDTIK